MWINLNKILNHPIFILINVISVVLTFIAVIKDFFFDKIYYFSEDEQLARYLSSVVQYCLIVIFLFFSSYKILKSLYRKIVQIYTKCRIVDSLSTDELVLLNKIRHYGIVDLSSNFKNTGLRLTDYEEIRKESKKSILIMGIGMTNISQNESFLLEQLNRNIKIRILMINPEVVNNVQQDQLGFYITTQKFNDFFGRLGYSQESKASFYRLKNFVTNYNNQRSKNGSIEMRVYSSFYPINLTVRDENETDAKLVVEFCFPMTTNRFRFVVRKDNEEDLFSIAMKSIEEIWLRSTPI